MRLTTQVAGVGNGHRHFGGARSDRLLPGLTVRHLLALGVIGGYHVPTPVGEGGAASSAGFSRPWAIPLTAGLGGLLAGLVVFGLAPEAEGHGTDSAIDAFHHNPKGIRARVSAVKIVASALTIGSGGRKGPTGQISAGFASLLGRWTNRSTKTTRIAIAAGIRLGHRRNLQRPDRGNGPRSRDPLYRGLRGRGAHSFSGGLRGGLRHFRRLCRLHPAVRLPGVLRVPPQRDRLLPGHRCAWGGSSGGPTPTGFYGTAKILHRIALPRAIKPALAGLAVGALGLVVAQVLGTGYGWVQRAMEPSLLTVPLWIVLVAPAARIAATAFSIGSGGSGGIFGPGMVIGAFTGAAVWRVAFDLGLGVPHDASPGRPSPQGTSPACWSISTKWSLCAKCFPHPRSSPKGDKGRGLSAGGLI